MSCLTFFPSFPNAECSAVFHKGGARLILCGKSWEKLEELADDLEKTSDPTKVRGKQGGAGGDWCLNHSEGSYNCEVYNVH